MDELELEVGDLRFRARSAGADGGELVLLLHGFPQTSWEWRHQLPMLAAAGYRAVAPDQRGYSPGARPSGVSAYRIEHLVDDALGFADALGAARFHVVGHDWGAIVAWHLAATHGERLRSLTAISVPHPAALASAVTDPLTGQALRSAYVPILRSRLAPRLLTPAVLRRLVRWYGLSGDIDEHVRVVGQRDAREAALAWYRAYGRRRARVGPVDVPTLFVWSTRDPALGRAAAERTADHVTGPYRFEVLEGVSHWIPETAPDRLDELLRRHLAAR